MKLKLVFTFLVLIATTLATYSQENQQRRTLEERVKELMGKITPALSLSAEQQAKTDSAYTQYYRSMQQLRQGTQQGTRPDRTEVQKLMAERDEKLKLIFTPEQYTKFKDEVESTLRPQRGNRQ